MKRLILKLQGYKLIDVVSGEWTHSYLNIEGEEIFYVDYSYYEIYYNSKKDKYKMLLKGYKPYTHFLHMELNAIIDFVNMKPSTAKINFTKTSQDYFFQRTQLFQLIEDGLDNPYETTYNDVGEQVRILRMDLEHYKNHLDKIRKEDSKLVRKMQEYKEEVLIKRGEIDIWQDLGNVIVTSEGCYFTAYNRDLRQSDGSDEENE